TDDDVFDLGGIDAGALHRMTQHVRRHRDAVGLVERAPRGARDAGPTVGDDGDVFHGPAPRCPATISTNSNSTDLASTTWLRPRLACRSPPARPEVALELRPEPWARSVRSRRGGEHTHHARHGRPTPLGEPPDRPTCIIRTIAGPVCRGTEGVGCCRLPGMCAESSAVSSLEVVSGVMPQATPALAPVSRAVAGGLLSRGRDVGTFGTLARAWHRTCVSLDGGGYSDGTEHHAPRSRECGRRARPLGGRGDRHHRLHGEPRPRAALRNLQGGALRPDHLHCSLNEGKETAMSLVPGTRCRSGPHHRIPGRNRS